MAIRHTPVVSSPARMARSTGAAPRQRGSREKWALTRGSRLEHVGLDDPAEGDDHAELGADAGGVLGPVADRQARAPGRPP